MTAPEPARQRPRQIIWVAVAAILILAGGVVVTLYTAHQQDAAMRGDLLTKARIGAVAADENNISALTGTDADLSSPAYRAIKDQLANVRAADPDVRFAYIMGERPDGTVILFADSEDPSSPDYSPPGQVYSEVPEPVPDSFATGHENTVGPYTDRWGVWVSGFIPLTDPVTGKVTAIFGMDINAGNWNLAIIRASLLPITATLVLLLMLGVFFSLQQRTERERRRIELSERALAESDRNFRNFFTTIDDMIVIATPEGRILFSNQALERTLGYGSDDLARMHLLDLHPPDLRREAGEIFSGMLRGDRSSCPLPVAAKDGTLVPVETRIWSGSWNDADCIFGIVKNLTAEQEAQQRFERLFQNNPALMALSSLPDRRFTDINTAFLTRLGYERSEVIGKTSSDLDLFPDPAQLKAVADRLKENGHISDIELQVRCKDGTIIEGIFSGEVISSQGRRYFLTVMIDITERKELEREKEHREQELVWYSDELNRDIAERKKVEQALTEANKKLNMFSGITRHDILNQITALSLMLQSLSDSPADDRSRDLLIKAQGTTERITRQIEFTREYMEIGIEKPRWQRVSRLIADAKNQLPACPFDVVIDTGTLEISADPLLAKVIYNILENAVRHGGSVSAVRFFTQTAENGLLLICEDDGTGIDAGSKKNLFRKGFGKHTEFGLYLMREILAITDITIAETGESGKGARFEMFIPTGRYRFSTEQ